MKIQTQELATAVVHTVLNDKEITAQAITFLRDATTAQVNYLFNDFFHSSPLIHHSLFAQPYIQMTGDSGSFIAIDITHSSASRDDQTTKHSRAEDRDRFVTRQGKHMDGHTVRHCHMYL